MTTTNNTGLIITTGITSGLAVVGIAAAAIIGLAPTAHAATPAVPVTPAHHSVSPAVPVKPVVTQPSASVALLQTELGRLNYYNGPINGYDNAATIKAVTYLQRDAHLTQTGHLNPQTDQALITMLINGNNNMNN